VCASGYKTTTESTGFALVCADDGTYDAPTSGEKLACQINVCNAAVSNKLENADYSSCASGTTGATCTPVCASGYKTTTESTGFALVCADDGTYDAPTSGEKLACQINECHGTVSNKAVNANYSSCASGTTGATCTPMCPAGYQTTGISLGFTLTCADNGDFDAELDMGDLKCAINSCSGNVSNFVENADYSLCSTARTGGTCIPVCPIGYTTTGASGGFRLVCDDLGGFDASADTGFLECTTSSSASDTSVNTGEQRTASMNRAVAGAICGALLFIFIIIVVWKLKGKRATAKIMPELFTHDPPPPYYVPYDDNSNSDCSDEESDAGESRFLRHIGAPAMRNSIAAAAANSRSSVAMTFENYEATERAIAKADPTVVLGNSSDEDRKMRLNAALGSISPATDSEEVRPVFAPTAPHMLPLVREPPAARRPSRFRVARLSSIKNGLIHSELGDKVSALQQRADALIGSTDPAIVLELEQSIADLEKDIRSGIGDIVSTEALSEYKRRLRLSRDRLHASSKVDAKLKHRLARRLSVDFDSMLVAESQLEQSKKPPRLSTFRPSTFRPSTFRPSNFSDESLDEEQDPGV
jgi:hypothetical protein